MPTADRHVGSMDAIPGSWRHDSDISHHTSVTSALPETATPEGLDASKPDSPRAIARVASGDSAISRLDAGKSMPQMRESRSRSRLRGLKFWKRRRGDTTGLESGESSP